MDLRSHYPFPLLQVGILHPYPSLDRDVSTDVVVMGAGISGALTAWYLCKAGFNVVVVEKRHVGMGSTAASTSLLQYEIDVPLRKLMALRGEKDAVQAYNACRRAIAEVGKVSAAVKASAGFELKPSFQYASFTKDVADLKTEFNLRKQHRIPVEWLEKKDIEEKWGFNAPAGILSKDGGQVNAYELSHALLAACKRMGAQIYDSTEVTAIQHRPRSVLLSTNRKQKLSAKKLVIACGYESQQYIPFQIQQLSSTYVIISEPMTEKTHWYRNSLIWETAMPYHYLRLTSDNRILIGGKDDPFSNPVRRDMRLPMKAKQLHTTFKRLFPQIDFRTDFYWAGTFGSTRDGLPYIGQINQRKNTFFALGFGGNGITFSLLAAEIVRDLLLGKKHPDAHLFAFDRKPV